MRAQSYLTHPAFSSRASAVETLAGLGWAPTDRTGATWAKHTCAGTELQVSLREIANRRFEVVFPS